MRDKVIKMELMNKNKRHIDLKMSSVKTRTAHSRDRCMPCWKRQLDNI